jgi:fatty-acyl-CoA synthase
MIAAPMFHSWGFAHFTLALPLSSTLVLQRRFDAEETLRAVSQHAASALVLVPVMLQRILELGEQTIARYDLSSLKVIALSGSALPGELATRAMDAFGDVLYNLYGSTEVAWATIATPEDLRAGDRGQAAAGTVVKLLAPTAASGPGRPVASRRQRDGLRGYTGAAARRCAGADEHRRRRGTTGGALNEGRDDEIVVSGGGRVPARGRGPAADHEQIEEARSSASRTEFGQFAGVCRPARGSDSAGRRAGHTLDLRASMPREVIFVSELPRNATGKVLKRELQASS